jgi:hypothetical protein
VTLESASTVDRDIAPRADAMPDARDLFARLAAEVAAARASADRCAAERYRFAGTVAALRAAGDAALAWTAAPFGEPLDTREGSGARDVALAIDVASGAPVAVELDAGTAGAGTVVSDARFVLHLTPGFAAGLDRLTGRVVALLRSADDLPHWERAKPLATLLGVWCHDRGVRIVHTGMAARDGAGVLFVGQSGSGKSTASLACLVAGFDFLGDDSVGLRLCDDGGFVGVRLYATATLERDHLERAVLVGTRAIGPRDARNKAIVTFADRPPGRIASSAAVRAVLLPRLTDAPHTTLRRASASEALLALAPSSIVRRAVPGATLLGDLARLVAAVPCFWLEMSRRPDEIPGCVERLLRELGSP